MYSSTLTNTGGMVAYVKGANALLMEVNSETDFASREPEFRRVNRLIAETILNAPNRPSTKEEIMGLLTSRPFN